MQLLSPTFSSDSLYLPTTSMSSEQQHKQAPSAAIVQGHAECDPDHAPHRQLRPQTHRLSTHLSWHACTILRHAAASHSSACSI
jgi:hypothetical protein